MRGSPFDFAFERVGAGPLPFGFKLMVGGVRMGGRRNSKQDAPGTMLEGKSRPRIISQPDRAITKQQRKLFLDELADTCNVLLSAKKAGFYPQRAYDLKARDADFRRGWDKALTLGYSQLELTMLERALHGTETPIKTPDGKATTMRSYSDRLGLTLLKMHREGAALAEASEMDEAEQDEIRRRLMARLDRLKEREEGVGTKGRPEPIGLIRWALGRASADR